MSRSKKPMFTARIPNRYLVGFSLAVVLILSLGGVVDGQDLSLDDLDRLGRQALRNGNYIEASRYFRLALEQAETRNASGTDLVMILGNLAEMLRSVRQYDEAEVHFNRALAVLSKGNAADKRLLPEILGRQGRLYQETGRYALSESL